MNPILSILRILAYPFGWLYYVVVSIRNSMFDGGFLKSSTFKTAVIVVGNITTGGTGKTPMVEFLIRILRKKYKIIELSRGYKRKSFGMQEAVKGTTASQIGDEPYQIFRKFPDVRVVVDANRCHAIEEMETRYPDTDVFILDDAFQHRYVNPGRSILLIDYNRPITSDSVLPYGNLRESASGRYRADIVVVTKCPANMTAFDAREIKNTLNLHAYQYLYFSTLKYSTPRSIADGSLLNDFSKQNVLLVSSIASSSKLKEFTGPLCNSLSEMAFPDHHYYTPADIAQIEAAFEKICGENKIILTTAKDESKLVGMELSEEILQHIYVIDVEVEFLFDAGNEFSQKIVNYVEKNKRNGVLFTK